MRRLIVLVALVLIVLAVVYRDRLFLRDPLARVEGNGAPVSWARVFINFSNDVLLQERNDTHMVVVQNWNRIPATPPGLTCVEGMLCLTPADRIVDAQAPAVAGGPLAEMSSREVTFTDMDGARVHVTLR